MTLTDEQIEKAAKAIRPWAFRELSYSERMSDDYAVARQRHAQEQARDLARAALEAVMPEGEPVAWGAAYSGKIATISLTKTRHHTAPLYAHPAPEPGELVRLREENERLRDVASTAFDAFEAHWSSAGGSLEEHVKFMQHRWRFYELYEPFRAALKEGGGE